jgi:GLPGLI family protein
MKKLVLLLLLASNLVNAQNYKVVYGKKLNYSQEEIDKIKDPNIRQSLKARIEATKKFEYELTICNQKAKFEFVKNLSGDNNGNKWARNNGSNDHYYSIEDNEVLTLRSFYGHSMITKLPFKDYYNWEITKDTVKIDQYVCYKAYHKRKGFTIDKKEITIEIEALFCPDFPLPFGPDNYYGLPGLIFYVTQKDSDTSFYLKSIKKNDCKEEIKTPKGKIIKHEDLDNEYLKIMGEKTGMDPEKIKAKMKEVNKK